MPRMIDEEGNIWDVGADGTPVFVGREGSAQPVTLGQVDPRKTAGTLKDTVESETAAATQGASIQEALAKAEKAAMEVAELKAKASRGGLTGEEANSYRQKVATLDSLTAQINRVQELFNQSQTGFSPLEYAPLPGNKAFDAASAGLAQLGTAAFRVPGQGSQSDFEAKQFMDANQPSSWSMDAANLERLRTIRTRIDQTRAELGLVPAEWQGLNGDQMPAAASTGANGGGPLAPLGGPNGAGPIATSADQYRYEPDPSLTGLNATIAQMIVSGAGEADIQAAIRARNGVGGDHAILQRWMDYTKRNPGKPVGVDLEKKAVPLSGLQQTLGDIVTNPFGAEAATYVNGALLGLPQLAMPDGAMGQVRDSGVAGGFLGDIGGAITGTGAMGKAASMTLGKAAPVLLGGGGAGRFGRAVATDATYGGALGATGEGDALTGALAGAGGSVFGQGAASAVGRGLMGAANPRAARLRGRGIPLTAGQAMGGMAKGVEDRIAGFPFVGDMIAKRRTEGLEGFNLAALNEGLSPVGGRVTSAGEAGIGQAQRTVGNAYDSAVSGVSLTPDHQFVQDMLAAKTVGDAADTARNRGDFGFVMDNQIRPIAGNSPTLDGPVLQDMLRTLRGQSTAFNRAATGAQPDPMAASVAGAFDDVSGAITGLAGRQAPDVMPQLNAANSAYRNTGILEDATLRGMNTEGIFTPAQLGQSVKASKFVGNKGAARGDRPFFQLQRDAQSVLPSKVPDSGTAGRAALGIGGAGLLAGGGGGYASGDASTGTALGGMTAGTLALLSTKAGQKMIISALMDRPGAVKSAGRKIRKRKGLFGAASVPLMVGATSAE